MQGLHEKKPPCSGTRTLRRIALVAPATLLMTLTFGSTGAFAAAGGNAADHANAAAASPNMGVGNGNGNGNQTHEAAMASSSTSSSTTTSTTSTAAPTTTTTTTAPSTSSSNASTDNSGSAPVQHGPASCPQGTTDPNCSPQPNSNADQNSGGANGQCTDPTNMGPYCSTRDGSASGNGNGNGKAVGKPCAGCVGKADNKNPHGQMPNGSDHNAGYECDRNKGIGQTNPAHTGCKSTPPPPPTCQQQGNCPPTPDCTNTPSLCPPKPDCSNTPSLCPPKPDCSNTPSLCPQTNPSCPPGEVLSNGTCQPTQNCVPSTANNNCQPTKPNCTPTAANNFCSTVEGEKVTKTPKTTKKTPKSTKVVGERVVRTPTASLPFTGANVALLLASGLGTLGAGSVLLATAGRRRRVRA